MTTRRKRREKLRPISFDAELPASGEDGANSRRYFLALTHEDQLHVRFDTEKGKITAFSVQYDCLIEGKWFPVYRVDARENELPHQHTFEPDGTDRKQVLTEQSRSYARIYHEIQKSLMQHFEDHKSNFIAKYEQPGNR